MKQQNKIKSICLIFENCEFIELLPNMFKYLVIDGITNELLVNCYQYADGEIEKRKTCDYFSVEILENGLKQKCSLTEEEDLHTRLLKSDDITQVHINYTEKDTDVIMVPWGDKEFQNTYQTHSEGFEDGSLKITITSEKERK